MSKLEKILSALPQTQCGLCKHSGCKPYAKALIANSDTIEKCHPGGLKTLNDLAKILEKSPEPYIEEVANRSVKTSIVYIDEPECIGCTKCIQACPVDAIIGTAKANHLVISNECTGCNLCIPVCPVDCIHEKLVSEHATQNDYRRERYEKRQARLTKISSSNQQKHLTNKNKIRDKLAAIRAKNAKSKS